MKFEDIQAVISDMDGVLWRGDETLPGFEAFFQHIRENDLPFMLATNNSSRSPEDYVKKLSKLGIPDVAAANIVSSSTTTADVLSREYPDGTTMHIIGTDSMRGVMETAGFKMVDDGAELVVVGLHQDVNYQMLKRACLQIRAGATFIATNDDRTFPTPEGLAPGNGSLVAAIQTATDQTPRVMGKPHAPMFQTALGRLGQPPEATLMIGDRLETDITGAQALGIHTALVLSGVTTPEDLTTSETQPDVAYEDLQALVTAWSYEGGKRRR